MCIRDRYLHKDDKELLRDIIVTVSERTGIDESIIEKDYYVTMILKELVQRLSLIHICAERTVEEDVPAMVFYQFLEAASAAFGVVAVLGIMLDYHWVLMSTSPRR